MLWKMILGTVILSTTIGSFLCAQNIVELGDGKTLILKSDGTYETVKVAATEQGEKVILRQDMTYEYLKNKELYLKSDGTYEYLAEKEFSLTDQPTRNNLLSELRELYCTCLLYTSPSPRDATLSRMPSSA